MLGTILLVFAFFLAACAAAGVGAGRFNLIGASLACYFASLLFGGLLH